MNVTFDGHSLSLGDQCGRRRLATRTCRRRGEGEETASIGRRVTSSGDVNSYR